MTRQERYERKVKKHIRNVLRGLRRRGATKAQAERAAVFVSDGPCCLCGEYVRACEASVDHLTPLSRGGTHHSNLGRCHLRCNRLKGDLTKDEWDRLRDFLHTYYPDAARRSIERRLLYGGRMYARHR